MRRRTTLNLLGNAGVAALLGAFMMGASFESIAQVAPPVSTDVKPATETKADPATAAITAKADSDRQAFDRLLVDAAVLRADFEDAKRGRGKAPVSISAYRSMELRLGIIASADAANTQAREMADSMQKIQMQILGPSVMRAAVADRQLYADEMSTRLKAQQTQVSVSGADSSTVRFAAPGMTKQRAQAMADEAKILDKAKSLQFRRVIFSDGRRTTVTYDIDQPRTR